jgi:hypothetical protein
VIALATTRTLALTPARDPVAAKGITGLVMAGAMPMATMRS